MSALNEMITKPEYSQADRKLYSGLAGVSWCLWLSCSDISPSNSCPFLFQDIKLWLLSLFPQKLLSDQRNFNRQKVVIDTDHHTCDLSFYSLISGIMDSISWIFLFTLLIKWISCLFAELYSFYFVHNSTDFTVDIFPMLMKWTIWWCEISLINLLVSSCTYKS